MTTATIYRVSQPASRHDVYAPLSVLLYSSNADTRGRIQLGLGRWLHQALPAVRYTEIATAPALLGCIHDCDADMVILDGEASPVGGLGLAKQIRDELVQRPPLLAVIGRAEDEWLARWAGVDAVVAHPIDPVKLQCAAVTLLTRRIIR